MEIGRALRTFVVVSGCAALLSGCGLGIHLRTPTTGAAVTSNELPTPPGPAEHAAGSPTPRAAVRSFARVYINWDATDVAARLRALARASVGQARSELQLEAAETRVDHELRTGGVANRGVVEAVSRSSGAGGGARYVVVTREETTASASDAYAGLKPAWHVTLATVRRVDGGRWAVSAWQPES